ncbi:hypothetical protein [Moorena sp. SIO4G3]|nr:hypothetical protein [Moorena sp. SIO4G3]
MPTPTLLPEELSYADVIYCFLAYASQYDDSENLDLGRKRDQSVALMVD